MSRKISLMVIMALLGLVYYSCTKNSESGTTNPCANITVTVSGTVVDASSGQSNGSITASASGASGFTFSLNGGVFQPSGSFSNLAAGNYSITAKSADGCTGFKQFTINNVITNACNGVTITIGSTSSVATPCAAAPDGSITATASGSNGFTFSLNGGAFQPSGSFSNLASGSYTVTAKDQNGCSQTTTVNVGATQAGPLFSAVRNILRANCALSGCHTTPSPQNGINFSDDCVIIAYKSNIKSRAVDQAGTSTQMPPPPNATLSAADRTAITNWVNAGGGYAN